MKKPDSCNGEFLQKPPEEFSALDDWKFSIWGWCVLLAPIGVLVILGLLIFG